MIKTAQTLYTFFSGFSIPAYAVNTVPDDATLPYLTYPLQEPEWNRQGTFYVTVYDRHKTSNLSVLSKADEIVQAIGEGVRLMFDGGLLVIWPQSPLIQTLPPDGDVRAAYINLAVNAYHMPGV